MVATLFFCTLGVSTAGAQETGVEGEGAVRGAVGSDEGPLAGSLVSVRGTNLRVLTSEDGTYRFTGLAPGTYTLTAAHLGYATAEASVEVRRGASSRLDFTLEVSAVAMDPIVVTGTMRETTVSESPVKVEVVSARFLQRIATSNLTESVNSINGLYNQVDCGVCYTNNIRVNGLEGPNTAVLIDGMPIMGALATVYGLNGINPAMIERLEVIKGPASTLYGSEALAGVVNVITRDPRFAPRFLADARVTGHGQMNLDLAGAAGSGRVQALFGGSAYYMDHWFDENRDGFSDVTLDRRVSAFGKLDLHGDEGRVLGLGAKYYFEDRLGGTQGFDRSLRGSDEVYGESIFTHRFELLGTAGLPFFGEDVRADFSYAFHDQDSFYGDQAYDARQHIGFMNLIWDRPIGQRHDFLLGGTLRYQTYDDDTPATQTADRRFIPGLFAQDEFHVTPALDLLLGGRLDHQADHGFIFSPRGAVKWEAGDHTTLRLNAGTGFRVVNLFTEDHAALSGSRTVVLADELLPERSVNAVANLNQRFDWGGSELMFDLDAFYTYFTNKIVPDYDRDPEKIVYDNLDGHAVSRGISVSVNQIFLAPFDYRIGFTLQDVYQEENGEREPEFFASDFQGTWSFQYGFPAPAVSVTYAGSLLGPMRLPEYPAPFDRPTRSPTYTVHDLQLEWDVGDGLQLYGGVRNLFDYRQGSPLIDPGNPFGGSFDTNYVYGPIQGRRLYGGLRFAQGR